MKTYTLTLTLEQVNLILESLAERPLKLVNQTFQNIHLQCNAQNQPPQPEPPPPEPKEAEP